MVAIDFYQKLTRQLELFLIQQAGFVLPSTGYELILLMPIDAYSYGEKRTLLVSAKSLDESNKRRTTYDILTILQKGLTFEEYSFLYNLDIIESNSFIVEKINSRYPERGRDGEFDVSIQEIGGATNQPITVLRSSIIEKLGSQQLLTIRLINGLAITGHYHSMRPSPADAELLFTSESGIVSCILTEIAQIEQAN